MLFEQSEWMISSLLFCIPIILSELILESYHLNIILVIILTRRIHPMLFNIVTLTI
jgi:hypothetical protein